MVKEKEILQDNGEGGLRVRKSVILRQMGVGHSIFNAYPAMFITASDSLCLREAITRKKSAFFVGKSSNGLDPPPCTFGIL